MLTRSLYLFPAVLFIFAVHSAHAITTETYDGSPTRTIQDYIEKFVDVPKGAINWRVLGATREVSVKTVTKDGFDLEYLKPEFPKPVQDLNGKTIIIKGFMFPLEQTEGQKLFLFGPFPVSCPFHYHVGPSLVIEVHAENPVKFSYDPITLSGTMELVPDDPEYGVFFRLKHARAL